ncbi:polysaccharide deacetylase family protein [Sporosarcina sp. UB5]|uniref:polysaccharide deacetylase family protein n=1 Tax=Sporosarcina sp. UB5 TaxID=3047463 RepID=UPI003D79B20B
MKRHGALIISLDFELNWGVHDSIPLEKYKENLLGVREAIPEMLELFSRYDIHATWAIVGMLFFDDKKKLLANFPDYLPSYQNENFSPYGKIESIGINENEDPFHYGLSLIKQIMNSPNQEIGTHTFSHYYCLEEGQTGHEFESDLTAACDVANAEGIHIKSIIFPRNQVNPAYLQICKEQGIQCYRGTEDSWVYQASRKNNEGYFKRAFRLLDCYINLFGHHTYPIGEVETKQIVNLPSSRFLRPYQSKFNSIESLRLKRIKNSLTYAAKNNEVFHLWWHPHNFGKNLKENIRFLREILDHVENLRSQYGFTSMTMEEATKLALQWKKEKDSHAFL